MPFPSFLQHIVTCNVHMSVNLVVDDRHSVMTGCDD